MRRLLRFLLLGLVLLLVAMASALTAMRYAIHGREVAVPNFSGMTRRQAEITAEERGLVVAFERRFYSATVPEGRVVSQAPAPEQKVRRGARIRLAASLGPQRASIPDVIGQSRRAAELNLRRRGLEIGAVATARLPGVTGEQVVAQSPPPEAKDVTSPRVSILVGMPEEKDAYVMPNFVGKPLAEVTRQIEEAGFKLEAVSDAPPTTPAAAAPPRPRSAAQVVAQSPAAGEKITLETAITLQVQR